MKNEDSGSARPTKVLIIDNSVAVTGALKAITTSCENLREYLDFVFVLPRRSEGIKFLRDRGFTLVYDLPMKELDKKFFSWIMYLPLLFRNAGRLSKIISHEQVELIHVNDFYNLLPVAARILGVPLPYVCHIRFIPDRFPAWLYKVWVRLHLHYASRMVIVSTAIAPYLPKHSKVVLIGDPIPRLERHPHAISSEAPGKTFLYPANYIAGKGHEFALRAFAQVTDEIPDWTLRFVGGDLNRVKNKRYRENLLALAKNLGVIHKVVWKDFADDMELEYKNADVVLNFSESESFSMTCLEALFFGKPTAVTRCGGPVDIIDHNQTGLLVENRNLVSMALAMKQLANDRDLRQRLGQEARIRIREKFGITNTSMRLLKIYREANRTSKSTIF